MKEILPGLDRNTPRRAVPEDAALAGESDSFRVYLSPGDGLVVEVTSYHPGVLCLPAGELREWLDRLEIPG